MIKKQEEIESINEGLESKVIERTSELIIAKEKAEESDRLKTAFLANMSHEIRTPMNGILGFSDLLKDPQLSAEEQQGYVSIIEKSSIRMLDTVNQIIDISKIDSGQMEVNLSWVKVYDEIQSHYEFFMPAAKMKGLKLTIESNKKAKDCTILTDKVKFNSIISNLIKNALKFTDNGSIKISYSQDNEYFWCSISDTGIGINKDKLSSIFNRFEQADPMGIDARQGSGLGLAITKSFIEMLNGKIWVRSKIENNQNKVVGGSIFNFKIPLLNKQSGKLLSS